MSIAENTMTVNLTVGIWQGHRLDKAASKQVTDSNGADADAARVSKHLIPKEYLKDIVTAAGQVRAHFYQKTLPWKDNGDRLLTRKLYAQFVEEHSEMAKAFKDAVADFLNRTYPAAKARAEFRMGSLFNANDYPTADQLRHRFYVALDIDAVTEAGDFRVQLDGAEAAAIRARIETATTQRLGAAMRDVWERLAETLGHFADKMAGNAIFRDTTVSNLLELVELLPGLNLLDDPNLDQIYRDLNDTLRGVTPKDLRKSPEVRTAAADETKRILEEMKGFMGAFSKAA